MDALLKIIALILDEPTIQDEAATLAGQVLMKKLPAAADKDVGDFLVRVGQKLNGTSTPAA